ncbi:hypothetical protein [Pseudocolwellia agarivorans]|uniref:hypothetical protein n=1 Tax=Pseudocolwellia agarivorans TaxID=1911682 RepID=UPI0009843354|nr:hypothetical protein [Pseudocolwellia agarivorans]
MNFQSLSDQQIFDIADPIMDNLMAASTEINHTKHVLHFTERMKGIVTPAYLQSVCEHYQNEKGVFRDRTPVAVFKRPNAAAIIWKQTFSKAEGEFVAEMLLVYENGQYLVDHVMVF